MRNTKTCIQKRTGLQQLVVTLQDGDGRARSSYSFIHSARSVCDMASLQAQPQAVYYTVQRGDTLFAIARRYGTSVSAIQKLNASLIRNVNQIQVGWKIRMK